MAKLTLADARRTMGKGRPWTFRLEFYGQTAAGNPSQKFWLCTGRARNEPVEIHYGAIGAKSQILVKTWDYVEKTAPEKIAKGYDYADTPFVRIRKAVIDTFAIGGMVAAIAYGAKTHAKPRHTVQNTPRRPAQAPVPTPAKPSPTTWRCNTGGVSMRIRGSNIEITFDKFPADWQGAVFGTFKGELADFCTKQMGRTISIYWGIGSENFAVQNCPDKGLFQALVKWLQSQIGAAATPLVPPTKLTGPYASIVIVKPMGKGVWAALNGLGSKVLDLTAKGARDLVADYPSIKVAGL